MVMDIETRAVIEKLTDQPDFVVIGASLSSVIVTCARFEEIIPGQDWDGRRLRILTQLYLIRGGNLTEHELRRGLKDDSM